MNEQEKKFVAFLTRKKAAIEEAWRGGDAETVVVADAQASEFQMYMQAWGIGLPTRPAQAGGASSPTAASTPSANVRSSPSSAPNQPSPEAQKAEKKEDEKEEKKEKEEEEEKKEKKEKKKEKGEKKKEKGEKKKKKEKRQASGDHASSKAHEQPTQPTQPSTPTSVKKESSSDSAPRFTEAEWEERRRQKNAAEAEARRMRQRNAATQTEGAQSAALEARYAEPQVQSGTGPRPTTEEVIPQAAVRGGANRSGGPRGRGGWGGRVHDPGQGSRTSSSKPEKPLRPQFHPKIAAAEGWDKPEFFIHAPELDAARVRHQKTAEEIEAARKEKEENDRLWEIGKNRRPGW